MIGYTYFIRKTQIPYTYRNIWKCVRIQEKDMRISTLITMFNPMGFREFIAYPKQPSEQDEIFQLRKRLRQWSDDLVIENPEDDDKK